MKISVEKVLEIINSNMGEQTVSAAQLEEDLVALGMDSIAWIRIVVALEEEFQCEIPDSKLIMAEMNTVNKILALLAESGG